MHCPHSPAKPGYLWDENIVFCVLRCTAASPPLVMLLTLPLTPYPSSYNSEETCPFCGSEIEELCHHSALQLGPLQPPQAWAPSALPLLSPAFFAELQDLQVSRCYQMPAQLSERSQSLLSLPPDTFRFPRPLIFPSSLKRK